MHTVRPDCAARRKLYSAMSIRSKDGRIPGDVTDITAARCVGEYLYHETNETKGAVFAGEGKRHWSERGLPD